MRRLRHLAIAAAATGAALALASSAQAGFGDVGVHDDFFDPNESLNRPLVESNFNWVWADDIEEQHNVRQDNKLFNSGPPTSNINETYGPIQLPTGKYHYYCTVHGRKLNKAKGGNMDGKINVRPFVGAQVDDYVPMEWALDDSIRVGDRWEVQYKVGNGKWKVWRKNTAALGGNFGEDDKPVPFNPSKVYEVRVKTKLASDPKKQSAFSDPYPFPFG